MTRTPRPAEAVAGLLEALAGTAGARPDGHRHRPRRNDLGASWPRWPARSGHPGGPRRDRRRARRAGHRDGGNTRCCVRRSFRRRCGPGAAGGHRRPHRTGLVLLRIAAGTATSPWPTPRAGRPRYDQLSTRAHRGGTDGWTPSGAKNYVPDGAAADLIYAGGHRRRTRVFAVGRDAHRADGNHLDHRRRHSQAGRLDPRRYPGRGGIRSGRPCWRPLCKRAASRWCPEQAGGAQRGPDGRRLRRRPLPVRTRHRQLQAVIHARRHAGRGRIGHLAARHVTAATMPQPPDRARRIWPWPRRSGADAFALSPPPTSRYGGIGFTWEHPAPYLRAPAPTRTCFGEPAEHRERYLRLKGA